MWSRRGVPRPPPPSRAALPPEARSVIDFVSKRLLFYAFSLALIIPGAISLILPNGLRKGIEFSSGSTFTARFSQPVKEEDMRLALDQLGHPGSRVQRTSNDRVVVRT